MGAATKIEWTDNTFNPWRGCAKVHTGCAHCYAEREAKRFPDNRGIWGVNGTRVLASGAKWREPIQWNRHAEKAAKQTRVFCASLADIFEDWPGQLQDVNGKPLWFHPLDPVGGFAGKLFRSHEPCASSAGSLISDPHPDFQPTTLNELRRDLFDLIDRTPHLTWQILTKRPENVRRMWPGYDNDSRPGSNRIHFGNVHLLYSASDQASLESSVGDLLKCSDLVPVIGLSLEPLVGPIDLTHVAMRNLGYTKDVLRRSDLEPPHVPDAAIGWVIVGGESGHGARPCDLSWIRSIVAQCKAAGVSCFVKQLGENPVECPDDADIEWGEVEQGIIPDPVPVRFKDKKGGDWSEWPEDLRVREFPEVHSC